MDKKFFCTLFDSSYLFKGVVMLKSLVRQCKGAQVFVLCLDGQCCRIVTSLGIPEVACISLPDFESEELLAVKKDRNSAEYCWTLSSCFTAWVMEKYPEVGMLTYLDADMMFFSPLQPLFDEIGDSAIAIIEHRFTPRLRHLESKGRFCVEWVSFCRTAEGLSCLNKWREQCLEWCYDRLEDDRMGDQKYLDEWPARYPSTYILQHPGAGLAPWNFPNYVISKSSSDQISVDGAPLIFYHFHQFQLLDDGSFHRLGSAYLRDGNEPEVVYAAYEKALTEAIAEVRVVASEFSVGMKSTLQVNSRKWIRNYVPRHIKEALKRIVKY